jgi:hypothetical protein
MVWVVPSDDLSLHDEQPAVLREQSRANGVITKKQLGPGLCPISAHGRRRIVDVNRLWLCRSYSEFVFAESGAACYLKERYRFRNSFGEATLESKPPYFSHTMRSSAPMALPTILWRFACAM